ncbi:MAG: TetR/AcrR family transcriptional regulator, partial [Pseudonocardiaceae bacterium]
FIQQEPDLYRFVVRRSFPDRPVQRDPVTTNNELIAGALAKIFRDWLGKLGMDPGGAETWAHAGVGMVQAAGDWWLERRTLSREALRDYLLMMVWGALDGILQANQLSTEKPTRRPAPGPIST